MKLLFLGVDGVLNSWRSVVARLGPSADSPQARALWDYAHEDGEARPQHGPLDTLSSIDPVCVALVNKVLSEPGIGLVLASAHRTFLHNLVPYGSPAHLKRLRSYLEAMGLRVPEFFDVTPRLDGGRAEEIGAWLAQAEEDGTYLDGEPFVILGGAGEMPKHLSFVRCDAMYGFSFENYARCCLALGQKRPLPVLL